MPRFKCINFYQNKPKLELFLQKIKIFRVQGALLPDPRTQPLPYCRFLVTLLILDAYSSYFHGLESCNEKLMSLPNNNRYLQ